MREYSQGGRSASEIAVEHGVTEGAIFHWLARHSIPRRTVSQCRAVKKWGASGPSNPMHGKTGALNPRYVDGSSPERQRAYVSGLGREFLRSILARDGYICRRCSSPSQGRKTLHVHHIKAWAGNRALRFDSANVVTLCRPCHQWVHSRANVLREWLA